LCSDGLVGTCRLSPVPSLSISELREATSYLPRLLLGARLDLSSGLTALDGAFLEVVFLLVLLATALLPAFAALSTVGGRVLVPWVVGRTSE
jgi:hypothetical protein